MNIAPGWYGVAGTTDVRWWDGAKFRTVLLRDGVVKYEQFRSQTPTLSFVLGVLMFVLGFMRLGNRGLDVVDYPLAVMFFVVGIFSLVSGVLGRRVEKIPAPMLAPYADPRTLPWPWQVEPGPIAPGWYAAPSATMPRWWTGARWADYINVRRTPMPTSGQRARVLASMWIVIVVFALFLAAGIVLWVIGLRDDVTAMVVVGSIMAVLFAVAGIAFSFYAAYLARVYTIPTQPPGYTR